MLPDSTRFLVMTPRLDGCDGISQVSRQVVQALVRRAGSDQVETWALEGAVPRGWDHSLSHEFRTARGSRRHLVCWSLGRALRAPRALEDLTIVVLHLHLAPVAAALVARGARLAVFIHGIEAWRPLRARDRYALRAAERVIANSERTAELFRVSNEAWRHRTIVVCPLGVGAPPAAAVSAGEEGFALIVGRLSAAERYKGHDALIDAWPAVRAAVPRARLVVVGDGDDRPRLETRVARSGLADAIRFTGRVSDEQLHGLYQAAALFVMPSSGEGFGLAYLEAMREGRPCIALRAADQIIEDGVSGLLLDDARPEPLAAALVSLFTDEALRASMGRAAAARVASSFTEEHFARRFCESLGLVPAATAVAAAHGAAARA
jgi:phosphatidylinositol alpha-1,6-mannosyltransferase